MINLRPKCTPGEFLDRLIVRTDDGPQPFGSIMAPFQREMYAAMENGLRKIVGCELDPTLPTLTHHYQELPRGSAKTTGQAAVALFALFSSPKPISGLFCAADVDQARNLIDAARWLVSENPILQEKVKDARDRNKCKGLIEVQANRLRNVLTESKVEIVSSDAGSAYGRLDDLVIVDEFTNWKPNAQPFWEAVFSGVAKRRDCVLAICANAPYMQSWQWPIRESFRTDPDCCFTRLDGPSPWIGPKGLEKQERSLLLSTFRRLYRNEPIEGSGDMLPPELVARAFANNVAPMLRADHRTYGYIASVDLALTKDFSAFLVLARDRTGRYRVAHSQVWKPTKGAKISIDGVGAAIRQAYSNYRFKRCIADPWQAEGLCELLRKEGIPIFTRHQSGKNLDEQCASVCDTFNSFNIDIPGDENGQSLRNQLLSANIVPMSYGFRFESPRNATLGHSDLLTCLSMALAESRDVLPLGTGTWGGVITPTGRGVSTGRSDPGYEAWKFREHLDGLRRAGCEILPAPYVSIDPSVNVNAAVNKTLRGNQ